MAETIRLMHYAATWPQEFEQLKSGILQACAGNVIAVEHIGSTAIPGLIARPVIDAVAFVRTAELLETAADQVEGLYFRRCDSPPWCSDSIWLQKPRHGAATHHLWLTCADSRTATRTLAIRKHLRDIPVRALEFEEAKIRRWKQNEGDALMYQRDKSVFFAHLEEQLGI